MVSLQGPVICPTFRTKAGCGTLPMASPLEKARLLRCELWEFKGIRGGFFKASFVSRPLRARKSKVIQCAFSSSSNGNGRMAENFNENDEDYVNSSVLEAGMLIDLMSNFCFQNLLMNCFKILFSDDIFLLKFRSDSFCD